MPVLSQSAFAKAAGVSRGRVSQMVAAGLPVDANGRIDVDAGRAWIAQNVNADMRRGGGRKKGTKVKAARPTAVDGTMATISNLRGFVLARQARLLDHELKRKNGEVVDKAEAERAIFGRARMERDGWLGFASRAAAVLAAEAGVDPGRSFPVLDRLVREHLAELASTPLFEPRSVPGNPNR
jgi:hypothetical protein